MTKLVPTLLLVALAGAGAGSTIHTGNRFAFGSNIGWLDWRANGSNGAVIGEYVCAGYIYSANVGWIHLGSGLPANGIRYQNNSASDFGVNHDGYGNLRGFAWGANIGWVNFEDLGAPRLDVFSGKLSGSVWGANVGWISLSNAAAHVQTVSIRTGMDSDADGIPDAFERTHAGNLSAMNDTSDQDGDGASDYSEYVAGTHPGNALSNLRITSFSHTGNTSYSVTWRSETNRAYTIERRTSLNEGTPWVVHPVGTIRPDSGAFTTRSVADSPATERYIEIRAIRPLVQ